MAFASCSNQTTIFSSCNCSRLSISPHWWRRGKGGHMWGMSSHCFSTDPRLWFSTDLRQWFSSDLGLWLKENRADSKQMQTCFSVGASILWISVFCKTSGLRKIYKGNQFKYLCGLHVYQVLVCIANRGMMWNLLWGKKNGVLGLQN